MECVVFEKERMIMHYVIGDVHGCYAPLMKLLDEIYREDDRAEIILLGDIIDRGPQVYETLMWAMNNITESGPIRCVRGNHEELALEWIHHSYPKWLKRPRSPLPRSKFDFAQMLQEHDLLVPEKVGAIADFFSSLPYRIPLSVVRSNGSVMEMMLVHAWHDSNARTEAFQKRINTSFRCYTGRRSSDYVIIHGHTPTQLPEYMAADPEHTFPGRISLRHCAINIDGGCCYGLVDGIQGHLCGICAETGKQYYSQL